jgi:CoA:oxalate CoA-transferase
VPGPGSSLPLDGVRVVDLSEGLAGPRCTKMLAELGADVVKVEPLGGDICRRHGPFVGEGQGLEASALFSYLNLNKRGVTLDLETEAGRALLRRLVADADVLVETFSPGQMDAFGLGYSALAGLNSRLVVTSITSFGSSGAYRDYEATDLVLYALGGQMYVSGEHDRHPLAHAYSQAQHCGGMNGAVATLAAFHHQQEVGTGQHVDVSILECIVCLGQLPVTRYAYTGGVETRWGPQHRPAFVKGFLPAKDGYVGLNPGGRNTWEDIARFLDLPELLSERFATWTARARNAEELNDLLREAVKDCDKSEFWHSAVEKSFTFQMVQRPEEAARSPQLEERGFFVDVDHPVQGIVTFPGDTYGFSETEWHVRRPAPLLGEHNVQIYGDELGCSSDELSALHESGVI